MPIPGSLQDRYRYVRSEGSGGESNLYVVDDVRDGTGQLMLKLYNTDVVLNEAALEAIKGLSRDHPEHVVRLVDWGVVPETGQWFEVQEYLHAGDLSRLVDTRGELHEGRRRIPPGSGLLKDVIAELLAAVTVFHGAGLSHHDIKPTNVLVRATEPRLDLVLGDFGLSIAADRTVFLSKRLGTPAYDSPESLGAGQGGPKRDFWALGMTIAELAGGRHPFSHPSDPSRLLTDEAIRDHLYHRRPIDLSAVDDDRVRRLCEGLTRYDETNRWGAGQVQAWLDGADPEVVPDRAPVAVPAGGVAFAGGLRASRQELAAAMSADWRAAVASLGTAAKRREFLDSVIAAFGSAGLDALEAAWAVNEPGVDRAVIDTIVALDPTGAPPAVKGYLVTADQLAPLARSVAAGDSTAVSLIEPLYTQHLLMAVAKLPGQQGLAELDKRWHATVSAFHGHCDHARGQGVQVTVDAPTTRAALLGALADPTLARQLVNDRDAALREHRDARKYDWFGPLANANADNPAAVLAARMLAQPAATAARLNEIRSKQERERLKHAVTRSWFAGWVLPETATCLYFLAGCVAAIAARYGFQWLIDDRRKRPGYMVFDLTYADRTLWKLLSTWTVPLALVGAASAIALLACLARLDRGIPPHKARVAAVGIQILWILAVVGAFSVVAVPLYNLNYLAAREAGAVDFEGLDLALVLIEIPMGLAMGVAPFVAVFHIGRGILSLLRAAFGSLSQLRGPGG